MIQRLFVALLFFVQLTFSPLSHAEEPKGALCLVASDDGQVVFTKEVLTGKLSLPGGTIEAGEPPEQAAQRETWEETGLIVTVGKELGRTYKAVIFDCVADSEVVAFSAQNVLGHQPMPAWFAPHFGIEMSQVMLARPENVTGYRYPEQLPTIEKLAPQATRHLVHYLDHAFEAAPAFHGWELPFIARIQSVLLASDLSYSALVVIDLLASPWLLAAVLVFAYARLGRVFASKLTFGVTAASMLALVAQFGLAMPRPWAYFPQLETGVTGIGFATPSVTTAVMVTLFGLLYRQLSSPRLVSPAITLVLLQGLASVALGNQFFSDIVIGAALGGLVVWNFARSEKKIGDKLDNIYTGSMLWWVLAAAAAIAGTLWPRPEFAVWLAVLISIAAMHLLVLPRTMVPVSNMALTVALSLLVLAGALSVLVQPLVASSTINSLIVLVSRFPVAVLLVSAWLAHTHKREK